MDPILGTQKSKTGLYRMEEMVVVLLLLLLLAAWMVVLLLRSGR